MAAIRRRGTFVTEIAEELRKRILLGELTFGEFLEPQKTLADQYGVSLSTIREAVQHLSAAGFVASHPGKGTWVTYDASFAVFDPAEVKNRLGEINAHQLYDARAIIEIGLIRYAAEKATPENIDEIWEALARMEAGLDDDKVYLDADMDYHLAVARAAHNQILEEFYNLVQKLLEELATQLILLPGVKVESIPLQASIAEAIEQHDVEAAREAGLIHMKYIEDLLQVYG